MSEQGLAADPFGAIRPYRDYEVEEVIQRLLYNEEFVNAIMRYQFPKMSGWAGWFLRPCVRIAMAARFGDIETISDVQQVVADYMNKMAKRTTTRLTCSGLDSLDKDEAYLFVSNHRDIAMDPALVNWVRYQHDMDTVRIAIGDNLLSKPYVADLMRLNKSFIVNRSAKGRDRIAAFNMLSGYIHHSIETGNSVWIAQREGRAKNGNDITDPAILKMFYMSMRKQCDFQESIARLNIVPVSLSYEYDPCDLLKARELVACANGGSYQKKEFEDISSIVLGITGNKGHVHLSFGEPITDGFETPDELAALIDQQIQGNYYLHPSNLMAAGELDDCPEKEEFEARLAAAESDEVRDMMRQMYANPVYNRRRVEAQNESK